ncbi:DNA-directed RNA polymerase i subunit rpa49 [Anaeramoeba flamelloides]|uniref:DNA-directed RNA polymerase i subunit rpa49 n=1 Tax=Anaeramoeba flamelloides TaxID=1746091 RepID=A0AAV7YE70_9EUKA|nr:DNA-directed RNA polymerase i subunit rpa49 [Anaeramoeba flamelloides]
MSNTNKTKNDENHVTISVPKSFHTSSTLDPYLLHFPVGVPKVFEQNQPDLTLYSQPRKRKRPNYAVRASTKWVDHIGTTSTTNSRGLGSLRYDKYYIGIRRDQRVLIYPISNLVTMQQDIPRLRLSTLKKLEESNLNSKESESTRNSTRQLIRDFGSRKHKRRLQTNEQSKVTSERILSAGYLEKIFEEKADQINIPNQKISLRLIPPVHMDAEVPKDAYKAKEVVGSFLWKALNVKPFVGAIQNPEKFEKLKESGVFDEYVLTRMSKLAQIWKRLLIKHKQSTNQLDSTILGKSNLLDNNEQSDDHELDFESEEDEKEKENEKEEKREEGEDDEDVLNDDYDDNNEDDDDDDDDEDEILKKMKKKIAKKLKCLLKLQLLIRFRSCPRRMLFNSKKVAEHLKTTKSIAEYIIKNFSQTIKENNRRKVLIPKDLEQKLISYCCVLSLIAHGFVLDPDPFERALKLDYTTSRDYFRDLGCVTKKANMLEQFQNNRDVSGSVQVKLKCPIVFPDFSKKGRFRRK